MNIIEKKTIISRNPYGSLHQVYNFKTMEWRTVSTRKALSGFKNPETRMDPLNFMAWSRKSKLYRNLVIMDADGKDLIQFESYTRPNRLYICSFRSRLTIYHESLNDCHGWHEGTAISGLASGCGYDKEIHNVAECLQLFGLPVCEAYHPDDVLPALAVMLFPRKQKLNIYNRVY